MNHVVIQSSQFEVPQLRIQKQSIRILLFRILVNETAFYFKVDNEFKLKK